MQLPINETTRKVVYFVRHGQSEDNAMPVFQGPDAPLSKLGQEQTKYIAQRAEKLSFDALISSPLPRAKQTAEAIAKQTNKAVTYSELFIERQKPSATSGKPYTDAAASQLFEEWETSMYNHDARVSDGENFADITLRAKNALDFLLERPEKTLLVVTHGYFFRAIVAHVITDGQVQPEIFKSMQQTMLSMQNTGLSVLLYQGGYQLDPAWRVWVYNDQAHLAD